MTEASSLEILARTIDDALPQTQCTRCGFPDCASYARAVAHREADINQCPPGGQEGVDRLARITGLPPRSLSVAHGIEAPRQWAVIDEGSCIGCTLCIKACPVDSIVGANKRMHTVIESLCTGCELCIPVCPVDCISLVNASDDRTGWAAWSPAQATEARERFGFHRFRMERTDQETRARLARRAATSAATADAVADPEPTCSTHSATPPPPSKNDIIAAALARARARKM